MNYGYLDGQCLPLCKKTSSSLRVQHILGASPHINLAPNMLTAGRDGCIWSKNPLFLQ